MTGCGMYIHIVGRLCLGDGLGGLLASANRINRPRVTILAKQDEVMAKCWMRLADWCGAMLGEVRARTFGWLDDAGLGEG